MPNLKHFLLQGMILLLWLLFVIFPITDTRVEAQASCLNPVNYRYLSPNPGVSWYADTTVTVRIDDSVFSSLRLWQDSNHNGISEASELFTLSSLGLKTIHLDYQTKNKVDEFGNRFRYRAKVKDHQDAQLGRWAWDVFLVSAP